MPEGVVDSRPSVPPYRGRRVIGLEPDTSPANCAKVRQRGDFNVDAKSSQWSFSQQFKKARFLGGGV